MKLIITGGTGFIGTQLVKKLSNKFNVALARLDLEQPKKFNYSKIKKEDFVIHLAAISSPDICEKQYRLAYKINVVGTRYFLKRCLLRGAKVLFFSSDTVYGETNKIANENSAPRPLGEYAKMKYAIEKEFAKNPRFKVFRLSFVFSKNDKFMTYLSKCSKNKTATEIFDTFYRNVVYIKDVLDTVKSILINSEKFNNKVFNVCGEKLFSRKDLAELYKKIVDKKLKIKIARPPKEFLKARAEKIHIKSLYLKRLLGRKPTSIEKAMKMEFNKKR